jgi:hypothetical protein
MDGFVDLGKVAVAELISVAEHVFLNALDGDLVAVEQLYLFAAGFLPHLRKRLAIIILISDELSHIFRLQFGLQSILFRCKQKQI